MSTVAIAGDSPLDPRKFRNPEVTAKGVPRAQVRLNALTTLWFNTGMLCNLTCADCYIESSPTSDRLMYLSCEEVKRYLDQIAVTGLPTEEIGFTGGEPFMNPVVDGDGRAVPGARLSRVGAEQRHAPLDERRGVVAGARLTLLRSADELHVA